MNLYDDYIEIIGSFFLIVGAILSILTPSAVINYLVILLTGLMTGRVIYYRKYKFKMGVMLIILAFVLGYTLVSPHGNRTITLLLFLAGSVLSYRVHTRGLIK